MNYTPLSTLGSTLFTTIGCAAYAQDAVTVPRLSEPVIIDGDLADWGAPAPSPSLLIAA